MRSGWVIASLCLAACSQQRGDRATAIGPKDAAFVQAFMSTCVRDFGNRARLEAAAKAMAWKPITDGNVQRMLGPQDPAAIWRGWAFEHDGAGFMLALSDSKIESKPVKTCVLISEPNSVQTAKDRIVQLVSARKQAREEENGQVTEIWKFDSEDGARLLTFIDAEPMGMKMLNAGVSTDWTNSK